MKVTIELSEKNEGTSAPFWVIIDPKQMMKPSHTSVMMMVHGLWFSRESAEKHLKEFRYRYSEKAIVWCMSGHLSDEWTKAIRDSDTKNDAYNKMLTVLEEIKECSDYWSEYTVPIGIKDRIDEALKAARGDK